MLFLVNMVRESLRRARLLAARTPALRRWVDSADDGGYAAYERLMVVLSFAEIPASFPGALLGADVVARQATYLRRWPRANPQKGELLSAPPGGNRAGAARQPPVRPRGGQCAQGHGAHPRAQG
jgi:hypothetical protein